jgi:hypothetical protein
MDLNRRSRSFRAQAAVSCQFQFSVSANREDRKPILEKGPILGAFRRAGLMVVARYAANDLQSFFSFSFLVDFVVVRSP